MSNTRDDQRQMDAVRQLVLGEDNQLVKETVEAHARELVGNVLTEALHDRQKADGTIRQVLSPLVEKSVETSVTARRDQFIGYLYPLVGGLVRKSVSAFLADLMERTNTLLESSLTTRGLKWRWQARRAGVSYSQYVVSQTFLFRVEQVLLIHRETGLLLQTVFRDKTQTTDADMVSAMLTAINDFVSDSFTGDADNNGTEQTLDEVKTDDFTLLVKQGPQVVLVAAITGNAPADVGAQLQLTLEDIHRIYEQELQAFDGDAAPLGATEHQLNDCLLSQEKDTPETQKKVPWAALVLVGIALLAGGYWAALHWQVGRMAAAVRQLPARPGIVLLSAKACYPKVCVDMLRDPDALLAHQWLHQAGLTDEQIQLSERAYVALAPELTWARLNRLAQQYPELVAEPLPLRLRGELSTVRMQALLAQLYALPDQLDVNQLTQGIRVVAPTVSDAQLNAYRFEQLIERVESVVIEFERDESQLTDGALAALTTLSQTLIQLIHLAAEIDVPIQLVVMGASDPVGALHYNQQLSLRRASTVSNQLIQLGVAPTLITTTGLGVIESAQSTRSVMFGIIRLK